jgi:peptidyl-dipeptidase Dcp
MMRRTFLAGTVGVAVTGAAGPLLAAASKTAHHAKALPPLLAEWSGPHGGVPPFNKIKPADFPAAFTQSITLNRAEIAKIAGNPAKPTFANTIAALEDAGRPYGRAQSLWGIYTSTFNSKEVQAIDLEWEPKFAAFADEVVQNGKLFSRIEAVYNSPGKAKLTPEQQRLVWKYYTDFVRSGAKLDVAQKKQLSDYNQQLASLYTQFSQNELADEENQKIVLTSQDDLKGLPQSFIDASADNGQWVIRNTRSAMEPFLTYSERRDLREKAFRLWTSRGDMGSATDNNKICSQILILRAKRAKLLGYETFAHWRLENAMAKNPENAMKLMMQVWPAAVARVHEEVADMQKIADQEKAGITIEPWDYRYYAEKVRKAKYDLDDAEIKPYLQMDKIRQGIFWASNQLYDFNWTEVSDVPVAEPDIRVFKVTHSDASPIGLWYFDPYARDGKSSGAWMNEYRSQERFKKPVTPVVSNNTNFVKAKPGEPVLVSWIDATTMFHEFGHAIHGLNSNVNYPSLAGTNVARDFVEFPSQLNENWLATPEVLNQYALHYQTGAPMPESLVAKIKKAGTFNQGFTTVEYLASAIVDMKLHLEGEKELDMKQFETETLAALGMPKEIVMRHRIPHFGHVFSGDGYAAGYYSYLWSEVLDHDAYQAFVEEGGPYNKKTAKRYHDEILSRGNTVDPADAYRAFRGRDQSIVPYLQYKGFPTGS